MLEPNENTEPSSASNRLTRLPAATCVIVLPSRLVESIGAAMSASAPVVPCPFYAFQPNEKTEPSSASSRLKYSPAAT